MLGLAGVAQACHEAGIPLTSGHLAAALPNLLVGAVPAELALRPLPAALEAATVLAPLFSAWIIAGMVWLAIRNRVRLHVIRTRGDHMVVSATGDMARLALQGELAAGRPAVAWHGDPPPGWLRQTTREGAATTSSLAKAGLASARAVLLASADDRANLAEADTIVATASMMRAAGDPLDIIVRIDDPDLWSAEEANREAAPLPPAARLRHASLPDLAARSLFVFAPLDSFVHLAAKRRGVLAIGFTPAIERTLARLLVGDHPRRGGKARITIATADPAASEAAFRSRNGQADSLAPIRFVPADLTRPDPATVALVDDCVACLVDCGSDASTLDWGAAIDSRFSTTNRPCPPIHLRLERSPTGLSPMLRPFGSLDTYANPQRLLQEGQDELARAIHEFYLEGRLSEGEHIGARASMREWEDLPERFRDDNRMVADCYRLKLRDIGARLVPGAGPPLRFTAEELEELARAEHDRWMIAKLATGWKFGETRNDTLKLHPDIVPYDALSERIKDLDREQIRIMTRLLGSSGQRAVRVLTVALMPEADGWPRLEPVLSALATHYPDRLPLLAVAASDTAGCAALQRLAPGIWRSLILCDRYIGPGPAACLIGEADTVVSIPANIPPIDALLSRAELALTCTPRAELACPQIRLAGDGMIVEAPWSR